MKLYYLLIVILLLLGLTVESFEVEKADVKNSSKTEELKDFGYVNRMIFRTSDCNNCGMASFGRVNIKVCGGGYPVCCGIVDLGNYGDFQQVLEELTSRCVEEDTPCV